MTYKRKGINVHFNFFLGSPIVPKDVDSPGKHQWHHRNISQIFKNR